jgi:hypothetical protein
MLSIIPFNALITACPNISVFFHLIIPPFHSLIFPAAFVYILNLLTLIHNIKINEDGSTNDDPAQHQETSALPTLKQYIPEGFQVVGDIADLINDTEGAWTDDQQRRKENSEQAEAPNVSVNSSQ